MLVALLLTIQVWFDGVPTQCVVDSGSTYTIVTRSAAARMGTLSPVVAQATIQGIGGTPQQVEVRYIPNVGTAHLGWPGAEVLVVDDGVLPGSIKCLLGADLLGQQPLMIDWVTQTVRPFAADVLGATLNPPEAVAQSGVVEDTNDTDG